MLITLAKVLGRKRKLSIIQTVVRLKPLRIFSVTVSNWSCLLSRPCQILASSGRLKRKCYPAAQNKCQQDQHVRCSESALILELLYDLICSKLFCLSLSDGSHFFGFSHQANEFWRHHSIDKGEFWQTNLNCHMKVRERITETGSQIKTEFSQFGFPGIVTIFRNPILLQSHLSQSGCPKYSIKQFSFYVPNLLFFSFLSS